MKISAKQQDNGELYALDYNSFTPLIWQLMRISLLTIFLMIISIQLLLAVNAKGQAMEFSQVTVGLDKEPFTVAIKAIEKQSKFRFFYRKSDVEELKQLSLVSANRSISQTLYELLKNSAFTYRQVDQNILIERKKEWPRQERKISGKIYIENTKTPIAYAVVELLKGSDSSLLAHSYTDTAGTYQILANSNEALWLRVSGLGYQSYTTKIEAGAESVNLPAIFLKVVVSQLKEITVSANKPLIQRKTDRFVVNVANSSLSINDNVWDVLKQVPLVNADDNGALSIVSKQGAIVYINGRKTNLSGPSLYNYLKSLPSSTLSNVEIITAPGSEFDASGNAGILNIIFKKQESDGFQGLLTVNTKQGNYNTHQVNGAFNYRKGNFGINITPFLARDRKLVTEKKEIDFKGATTSDLLNLSVLKRQEFRNFYGANLNAEYSLSSRQLLAGNFNYNPNQQTLRWNNYSSFISKSTQRVDSSFLFTNNSTIKGHSLDVGLNYQFNLDTLGQDIIASADYFEYVNKTNQVTLATLDGTPGTRRNEISILPQKIKNYTFAIDYKTPIGKMAKFKLGLRSFNTATNNNLFIGVADQNGVYIKDELRTTNYQYEEHINALYAGLDFNLGKLWSVNAGLRLEQSSTYGKELITQTVAVDKDYFNVFPSLSVNFTANANHIFSYTLSKRINRPDFWQLNNLRIYSNPTQYVEGNPFLQSSYILKNELSYTYRSRYIALLSYSHITDNFSQFILANNNNNITRIVWLNYGTGDGIDLAFIANFSVGKFIQSSLTATGSYNSYKGKAEEEVIENSGFSANLKMNNTIQLNKKKGWSAFLNANYLTATVFELAEGSKSKPRGSLNIGFRKVVNQFVFTLSGNDILQTMANRSLLNSRYAITNLNNYWDTQNIQLNVRYNFGNTKLKKNKPQENAAQEVIRRTGG